MLIGTSTGVMANGVEESINSLFVEKMQIVAIESEQISRYSQDNNVNIVVYDSDGNIMDEYHSDGLVVNYTIDNTTKKVSEISNSEGVKTTIMLNNKNEQVATTFNSSNEVVKTQKADVITTKTHLLNNNTNSIKNATMSNVSTTDIANMPVAYADHIQDGYNLSNLVQSVWTSANATDKFGRPPTAMSLSAIQNYLQSKNSVLQNPIVVWAYNANGILYNTGKVVVPSEVIDYASRTFWINPKILLGKLQGESSLVYAQSANVNTRSFAFCMGYNATDGGDIYNGTGFDSQINNAASILLHHWNTAYDMGASRMPYYFNNADTDIYVNNCGTFALYTYTPWVKSNLLLAQVFKMMFPGNGQNNVNWD